MVVPSTVIAALRAGSKPGAGPATSPSVRELERLDERFERVDRVVRVDRPVGLDRAARDGPGEQQREVVALVRQQVVGRRGREHVAELEQREVGQPLARVERPGLEQPGEDRRPQERLLGPQRVRRLDGSVGREPEPLEVRRRDERNGHRLGRAGPDHHVLDQPPLALAHRETAGRRRSCAAACAGSR